MKNAVRSKFSTFLLRSYTNENIYIKTDSVRDGNSEGHFHDCFEFELVTEGEGYQILNGSRRNIAKATLTLLGPLDYHSVGACGKDVKLYTLMFHPEIMPGSFMSAFTEPGEHILDLDDVRYGIILSLFEALYASKDKVHELGDAFYTRMISCILEAALPEETSKAEPTKYTKNFHDILTYINLTFRENPTIGDIARLFHYNKNYVCNLFEKNLGISYVDYITDLKVRYAEKLLETTDFSITRICFECGFGSVSSFARSFKKITGKTPTAFRKKLS